MKTYIFAAVSILGLLSTQVSAYECTYKEVPSTNTRYVLPIYTAKANFFFDKSTKEAYVLTSWDLDIDKTKECFNLGKEKYRQEKIVIPTVRPENLEVQVMGATSTSRLDLYPLANGHWSGSTGMIYIPFSKRAEIEAAIKGGKRVIEILGDLRFRLTINEKNVLGKVECIEKNEEAGVLNLFRRFGDIRAQVEGTYSRDSVIIEEVMQDFLVTCVLFQNVDSNTFLEFDQAQRLNSRIVNGNLYIKGYVAIETTEEMPTSLNQNASLLDI
jgi:hypothetical protein